MPKKPSRYDVHTPDRYYDEWVGCQVYFGIEEVKHVAGIAIGYREETEEIIIRLPDQTKACVKAIDVFLIDEA